MNGTPATPRVAIVSDPLVQRGGAERVVQAIAAAYPDAPIYALLYSAQTGPADIAPRIRESWLGRIPGASRRHRFMLPLFVAGIESFDLSAYDVIISSHHSVAKGLLRRAGQVHVCYCHTPMRALWERPFDEINGLPAVARPAAHALFSRLRVWDVAAANRVDRFVANSRTTQQRIATHYRRESVLLNPPIDTERFTPAAQTPGDYYLIASRPVPYKRIDVAVAAAAQLGRRVVLVGGGDLPAGMPGRERVEVRGHVDDATLMDLMRGARALLFPQLEDFGMTPLEMNACGRPVVAYRAGGALETVVPDVTGVFAAEQTPASFAAAMLRLESLQLDPAEIRRHAERFSRAHFIDGLQQIVTDAVAESRA